MSLVKLFGHLRDYAGGSEFEVAGQTVGGVLTRLSGIGSLPGWSNQPGKGS